MHTAKKADVSSRICVTGISFCILAVLTLSVPDLLFRHFPAAARLLLLTLTGYFDIQLQAFKYHVISVRAVIQRTVDSGNGSR